MHLNQLYGIIGRKKDLIDTINVYTKDLEIYVIHKSIKNIIEINEEISILLVYRNINSNILKKFNTTLHSTFYSDF